MDFGKVVIPIKWEEMTLKQFQELTKIYEQDERDILDIISLFTDKSKEELRLMPSDFIETMLEHLQFLNTKLEVEPKDSIEINGQVYKIKYTEKLKFGEWVDAESIIKDDEHNYAGVLGIMLRLDDEEYDDDFIANKLDDRIKLFENLPLPKALVIINFFLKLKKRYIAYSLKSSALMEGKELARQLVQSIRNSLKDGGGRRLDSIFVRRELRKLEKSLECI